MSLMGKCSTTGCHEDRVVTWPLLGNVGLCGGHHARPTSQFAGLVAEANAPPDDFDIPEWPKPADFLPRYLTAAEDIWVTKEGRAVQIRQLEDSHLLNIHRMLQRIEVSMEEVDVDTGDPTGADMPGNVREMFDRKQMAICLEIQRREQHCD